MFPRSFAAEDASSSSLPPPSSSSSSSSFSTPSSPSFLPRSIVNTTTVSKNTSAKPPFVPTPPIAPSSSSSSSSSSSTSSDRRDDPSPSSYSSLPPAAPVFLPALSAIGGGGAASRASTPRTSISRPGTAPDGALAGAGGEKDKSKGGGSGRGTPTPTGASTPTPTSNGAYTFDDTNNEPIIKYRHAHQISADAIILNLPALRDTPPGPLRRALLFQKLRLCSHLFDSSAACVARQLCNNSPDEQNLDLSRRETKRSTLLELVAYHTSFRPVLHHTEQQAVFDMLCWNLFRPLPPSSFELYLGDCARSSGSGSGSSASASSPGYVGSISGSSYKFSPEEDAQLEEPDWAHLQVVYELLLRMVTAAPTESSATASGMLQAQPVSIDNPFPEQAPTLGQLVAAHKNLYAQHLTRRFLLSLLANFASEDIRERDYLKTILHRVYGHSMTLRPFIRRNIQHILSRVIYDSELSHGVSELLEILGSIINGFATPLKDSHVNVFLKKILVPLHKITHLTLLHPQLSYCIVQFVEKDPRLAGSVLEQLLKLWPRANSKKEVLFLNEVEEILERVTEMTLLAPATSATSAAASPASSPASSPTSSSASAAAAVAAAAGGSVPATSSLHPSVLCALFSRVCACMASSHFQVAEKAVAMLDADCAMKFVFFANQPTTTPGTAGATTQATGQKDYRAILVPIIAKAVHQNTEIPHTTSFDIYVRPTRRSLSRSSLPPLSSSSPHITRPASSSPPSLATVKGHWNSTIAELTLEVARMMDGIDPSLWARSMDQARREYAAAGLDRANAGSSGGASIVQMMQANTISQAPRIMTASHSRKKSAMPTASASTPSAAAAGPGSGKITKMTAQQ